MVYYYFDLSLTAYLLMPKTSNQLTYNLPVEGDGNRVERSTSATTNEKS